MRLTLLTLLMFPLSLAGKPPINTERSPALSDKKSSSIDFANAKADHTSTAANWFDEFKKDEKTAKAKYAGKVIELTGTMGTILEDTDAGIVYLHLNTSNAMQRVRCVTKEANVWEKLCEGAVVTIRGTLNKGGFLPGELMPATVVKVVKNPALSMTATELAKQYKSDLQKLKNSANEKWAYVEGELVTKTKTNSGDLEFTLKGNDECHVICATLSENQKKIDALKPGQKVKVLGRIFVSEYSGAPKLDMCIFKPL